MKKFQITREMVEETEGMNYVEQGHNLIMQCRKCVEEGGDTSGDNLSFNAIDGYFKCWPNEDHHKQLHKEYREKYGPKTSFVSTDDIEVSMERVKELNKALMQDSELVEVLRENAGYTIETIKDCQIGYSSKHGLFVLPMFDFEGKLTGYEFRCKENDKGTFKLTHKSKDYAEDVKRTLCKINNPSNPKNLLICAGFKDGYTLYQYLKEQEIENDYLICTNSNGEPGTVKALKVNGELLNNYEKLILVLDNDKAGKAAVLKVVKEIDLPFYELKLPFIENQEGKRFKDFTDWYKLAKENNFTETLFDDCIRLNPYCLLGKYINGYEKLQDLKKIMIEYNEYEILKQFKKDIIPFKSSYYEINTIKQKSGDVINLYLEITRKSNFTFSITRKVVSNSVKFDKRAEYQLEIITIIDNKSTKPVILTLDELLDVKNIHKILKTNGIHLHILSDPEFKNIILNELRKHPKELQVFENPGTASLDNEKFWMYKNGCIDLKSNTIIPSVEDSLTKKQYIDIGKNREILLNTKKGMRAPFLYIPQNDDTISSLCKKYSYLKSIKKKYEPYCTNGFTLSNLIATGMFINTLESYKSTVEPFLILGNAILSPYLDIIVDELKGYPISFAFGEAQSGKSNLLELIANIFGFNSSFLSSGNDTSLNLLHNIEYYNHIPLLFSEVENNIRRSFETTIKAVYDRNPRKIMKGYGQEQDIRAVNATLHFASNDMAHKNLQTSTRLIFTDFKKDNFDYKCAQNFNEIRDQLLSLIMKDILSYYTDKQIIIKMLKDNSSDIRKLGYDIDSRSINNLALAKTGMDLLFKITGLNEFVYKDHDNFKGLQANYDKFLVDYNTSIQTKDGFSHFIEVFICLVQDGKVQLGDDYKITKDDSKLAIYLKGVYPRFKEYFKRMNENQANIPSEIEIKNNAKKLGHLCDHPVKFKNDKSKRAIYIDLELDDYLRDYVRPVIMHGPIVR